MMSTMEEARPEEGADTMPANRLELVVPDADLRHLYDRHLACGHAMNPHDAGPRERFEAVAATLRDLISERWIKTNQAHDAANAKRVYYLSMEFLIGRSLSHNIINLMAQPVVRDLVEHSGLDLATLCEEEPDAGLGNGGLGRLAACFIDSLATLQIPAMGYGLRYEYGIFRQEMRNGFQVESPDHWLRHPDPWELARTQQTVDVRLGSGAQMLAGDIKIRIGQPMTIVGVPYDRPVVGYGGRTVNTLRLWGATASDIFDLDEFNSGDFFSAVHDKVLAENLTRVLYPGDSTAAGQGLRLIQEYFLVACSIKDILDRFRRHNDDYRTLPEKVAIQLNDTHPALAVAELMRHLLDHARLGWDDAWDITRRTLAYTNHTLLPEALETWPVRFFEWFLPRQLEIIYGINARFMNEVQQRYPHDHGKQSRLSLIEEHPEKKVRMANLAILGTHSTNGVAEIHSGLLRTRVVRDFAEMFPERFGNQTNGVTPRRWLLMANPALSGLITETIGDKWVTHLDDLELLRPLADDRTFQHKFREAKRQAKLQFIDWLRGQGGPTLHPEMLFDSQIKRIHEYKRQLLNALHVVVLYNRLRLAPDLAMPPRVVFFAGKAAPSYTLAKLIIKFINNVAAIIDRDPVVRGRLKVMFLPNYSVSLAERLIPATDLSEQISTAGYEASGTGNMKFMMNGALTIGTRDGATIEMAQAAGEENFFLFGLNADQVAHNRSWYSPAWHYHHEPETRAALDLIFNNHFSPHERGLFEPLRDLLLTRGDYYMHLADLGSYVRAQESVNALYVDPDAWTRKAILNVAASGRFSSDRTIRGYAEQIWKARSVVVD
jgi:starch phosphorylase